jgi:hypothetical protein
VNKTRIAKEIKTKTPCTKGNRALSQCKEKQRHDTLNKNNENSKGKSRRVNEESKPSPKPQVRKLKCRREEKQNNRDFK